MEPQILGVVVPSFIALSLLASGVYVFNDLRDIEEDRSHPIKCRRPLPSGEVSPGKAKVLSAGLFLTGFGLAALESLRIRSGELFLLFCAYVFLNVLYTCWLKRFSILDVAIIGVGFVIRILLGAVSSAVLLSNWIVLMTFLLALFLGFGKRRDDLIILNDEAVRIRKSAAGYSLAFLDAAMVMMGSIVVVAYMHVHRLAGGYSEVRHGPALLDDVVRPSGHTSLPADHLHRAEQRFSDPDPPEGPFPDGCRCGLDIEFSADPLCEVTDTAETMGIAP